MMMLPDPTEVMPTRNPATRPIIAMPMKDFMVGGRLRHAVFDAALEQQQDGDNDQQNADRSLDKVVDARRHRWSQMGEKTDSSDGPWHASRRQSHYDVAADRSLA